MKDSSKSVFIPGSNRRQCSMAGYAGYQTLPGPAAEQKPAASGALLALHDDHLAAGVKVSFVAPTDMRLLLAPLSGAITFTGADGMPHVIEPGTASFFDVDEEAPFSISNPAANEPVRYLQYRLNPDANGQQNTAPASTDAAVSGLHVVCSYGKKENRVSLSLGIFNGREEGIYAAAATGKRLFVFVVQGAFEVQHRLLEGGDGMVLWELAGMELEALSNNAVIAVLEFGCLASTAGAA